MHANTSDYGSYRVINHEKSTVATIATGDTTAAGVVTARDANHSLFIQRILLMVSTDAAQTLTFQDSNGSPVVIAKSKTSPGLGLLVVADFGPRGKQLTAGKNLDIILSGAGLGCQVDVEAYEKRTVVGAA